MASFMRKVKVFISRSMKFIRRNLSRLVKAVKFKVGEASNRSKRRELVYKLGEVVFNNRQNGLAITEEAAGIAQKIAALDEELDALRNDRAAQKAAYALQRAEDKAARAAEKAAAANMAVKAAPVPEAPTSPDAPLVEQGDCQEVAASQMEDNTKSDIPTLNV